jgi:hypothetical protein
MTVKIPEVPEEIKTERLLLRMPRPGDGKTVSALTELAMSSFGGCRLEIRCDAKIQKAGLFRKN